MGNWRMVIEGTGPHHNGYTTVKHPNGVEIYTAKVPSDADVNFWDFIKELKGLSQKINLAKFEVIGGQVEYEGILPIMHHPV